MDTYKYRKQVFVTLSVGLGLHILFSVFLFVANYIDGIDLGSFVACIVTLYLPFFAAVIAYYSAKQLPNLSTPVSPIANPDHVFRLRLAVWIVIAWNVALLGYFFLQIVIQKELVGKVLDGAKVWIIPLSSIMAPGLAWVFGATMYRDDLGK